MALAPVAYCLWQQFLRFDPQDPIWPNRDRFVLSAGHASMLLYSLLHLTGVKAVSKEYETLGEPSVPLDAIKHFRQLDSRCPGHPEYRWTSGVETTTGPLGQGLANSVGMAIAGRWMAAHFNQPGFEDLINFNVYALCGDGCMMEGHLARGGVAGRSPEALEPVLDLRQQSHHHRRQHRAGLQRRRGDPLHRPTAGTSRASATPTTWRCSRGPSARSRTRRDRPTLIIVDSHIAYGAPEQAGHQRRPRRTARRRGNPADQAQLRLAGGRQVSRSRRRLRPLPQTASASAARSCATPGSRGSTSIETSIRSWPTSSIACSIASCRKAGTRTCPRSRRTPRAWRRGMPPGKVLNAIAKNVPVADGRLGRSGALDARRGSRSTGPAISPPTIPAGAICTSAFASTPWPRC